MTDRYESKAGLSNPAVGIASVTPDDDTDLAEVPRAIMVTGEGDVAVTMLDGSTGTLPGLIPGQVYQFRVTRIAATGTTATGIVALF